MVELSLGVVVDEELEDDASGVLAGGVTVTLVSVEGVGLVTVESGVGVMVVLSSFLVQAFSDNASKAASRTEYFIVFPLYKLFMLTLAIDTNPGVGRGAFRLWPMLKIISSFGCFASLRTLFLN